MTKRVIAALLAACMLSAFTACGKESGAVIADTTEPGTALTEAAGTDMASLRASVSDNLPDKKWDGKTYTMLIRTGLEGYFYSEEATGDTIDEALYARDLAVAERFDVKLAYIDTAGGWGDQANFTTFVRTSIGSADGAFMLGDGYAAYITGLAGEKLFADFNSLSYIDTAAPWWHQGCTEEMTIGGKCYFLSGDLSLYTWGCIFAIIFNKQLAADYSFGDLYSLVSSGGWTLDKAGELCRAVYNDTDNSGGQNLGDTFGMTIPMSNNIDAMQVMFGCDITVKDENGLPVLNLDDTRFVTVAEKLHSFLYDNIGVFCAPETVTIGVELLDAFKSGQAVFNTQSLAAMESLRAMDVDFGIIPYPKLDEAQSEYHSVAGDPFTLFFMPVNVADPDFASMITEALCAESYRTVIPMYYETALKTKFTRDDESQAMIDLIRDTLTFNFGAINSVSLADGYGPAQIMRVVLRSGGTDFASNWAKMKKGAVKRLEKLLSAYTD